jgi:DNA mismatch repair protein MutS
LAAAGALYRYAQTTQMQALAHVTGLTVEHESSYPAPGCRHPAQSGNFRDPARRNRRPTLLSLFDYLRHQHGFALVAPLPASSC